jgi:glycosyltransferase involved in cell wall biosynthesis
VIRFRIGAPLVSKDQQYCNLPVSKSTHNTLHMKTSSQRISLGVMTLYPHNTVPGQRYRIEQWESDLEARGIDVSYFSFADPELVKAMPKAGNYIGKFAGIGRAFARRLSQIRELSRFDVVLIYRAAAMAGPAFFERWLQRKGKPLIYDFDDAIFLTHAHEANKLFSWAKFAGKTGSICKMSDAVTVGNEWLADYARKFNPNVTVIPSSVDTTIYVPAVNRTNKKIVVGWTGSSTSQTHLEMFVPLLKELIERYPVEIQVHSDRSPDLPGVPVVWHKWTPENEVEIISGFDIGIMPMPDDEWSQGKCSMKALLYMSLAVPTVCSDIGMNREVIEQGVNGFLAGTNEEWLDAIGGLVESPELRAEMGRKARETVVENYSTEICAARFADVVRKTVEGQNRLR